MEVRPFSPELGKIEKTGQSNIQNPKIPCKLGKTWKYSLRSTLKNPNFESMDGRWLIYIKQGWTHFKHNEWGIPLPQILIIYQRIGKNGILNPLRILRIRQNFWPWETPWIKISTVWCTAKADMWNENTSGASLHLTTDFMKNNKLNLCKF